MLMEAVAYNLEKYLKFDAEIAKSGIKTIEVALRLKSKSHIALLFSRYKPSLVKVKLSRFYTSLYTTLFFGIYGLCNDYCCCGSLHLT